MNEAASQFKMESLLDIKGKAYLPVAARVVIFRHEQGFEYGIETAHATIDGQSHMRAKIVRLSDGVTVATASKRVKAQGLTKDFPIETAETGAIGRALALCGYGTMFGDLDEGDQIADSPIQKPNDKDGRPRASSTPPPSQASNADTAEVIM